MKSVHRKQIRYIQQTMAPVPTILLVCGYYHKSEKKEAGCEGNAKDIAAGCRCVSASSTTSGDYFVRVLQQQPNLRELVWRLEKVATEVVVVFMYDIAHKKLARTALPKYTHVVLSGGKYNLDNIDTDYLFDTVDVGMPILGICQGFHLICKKYASATIEAGATYKAVEAVRFERTGVLAAGDKSKCAFNHMMYAKTSDPNAVMHGDYAVAYESGHIVGVQWHPEQDDASWGAGNTVPGRVDSNFPKLDICGQKILFNVLIFRL